MKFVKLESRGGNYLVVPENVAWLRVADKGQTSVGIIGGQPLLVVGSPEEVAAKLLEAAASGDAGAAAAPPAPAAAPAPAPVAVAAPAASVQAPQAALATASSDTVSTAPATPCADHSLRAAQQSMTLSERIAAAAAKLHSGR